MDISQAAKLLSDKITEPQQRAALNLLLEELDAEVRTPPPTLEVRVEAGTQWTGEQIRTMQARTDLVGSNSSDSPRTRDWIIEAVTAFEREINRESTPVERSRVRGMVRWLARRVDLATRARLNMHPESNAAFQSVLIRHFGRDLAIHGIPMMPNQKVDFIRRHLDEHGYTMLEFSTPTPPPPAQTVRDAILTGSHPGGLPASGPDSTKARTLARWMVFFWEGMSTAERNAFIPSTVGAVEHVEYYVDILSDFYDADLANYTNLDHPGVYEYEVLEELGRWAAMRSSELRDTVGRGELLNEANRRAHRFYVP